MNISGKEIYSYSRIIITVITEYNTLQYNYNTELLYCSFLQLIECFEGSFKLQWLWGRNCIMNSLNWLYKNSLS